MFVLASSVMLDFSGHHGRNDTYVSWADDSVGRQTQVQKYNYKL